VSRAVTGWLVLGALALSLVLVLVARSAMAEEAVAKVDHFRLGTDALSLGKFDDAIEHFEAHADREPSHPDASFNRGLAYLMRVRAEAERPGDLGRSAAAFEEALTLRAKDGDAEHAIDLVRGEVARRRSRRGKDAVLARPTLDRVIVTLARERSWALAAVIAAFLLGLGMVLKSRPAGTAKLAGTLLVPACAIAVLIFMPLYLGARHLRLDRRPAVLVVREAHLSDESGVSQGAEPIPEAALVEVGERRGRLVQVRYGSSEGWIPAAAVRVLRSR
jgi:hypothetical protein